MTSSAPRPSANGLEGIVVADTRLSEVDGERGRLVIAGHDVEALAASVSFEQLCGLLWRGRAPTADETRDLGAALGRARVAAFDALPGLGDALRAPDGMDALRGAIAQLPASKAAGELEQAIRVTAAVAVAAAAWGWLRCGLAPVAPDPRLPHATDYLRMARIGPDPGRAPHPAAARALERYLVTVSDHGMNASTFAARVVTSTGSDLVSAVVAAIGALKGPLHGGAPGPVLDMLDAVQRPEHARAWVSAELAAGRRIMGMGHRIYRVRDPRAAVLESAARELSQQGLASERLALARAIEREATLALAARHPTRPLAANVEFYTAILLDAVGLDRRAFSPTFAVGRVAGWCAHVFEQAHGGRLIRPASRYIGDWPASDAA